LQASLTLSTFGPWGGTATHAVEPLKRPGSPRLSLSLAAYSFRSYFKDSSHSREKATDAVQRIDMFQFVDFCAEHGCAGAEVTSYYFPAAITEAYLIQLRRHAFLRGIAISGTAVGNDFTQPKRDQRDQQIAQVKAWVDKAAILGAPHIRIFAGAAKDIAKEA